MRVRAIPHETRSRSDKVLTGTKFCELQQKPSVHLPTPNKYNEGSCYSSQNQAPVRHKVLTGTCFCEIQQEPSMYLLASTHMWVTSTRGFVLYLTKTGPGQPKSYDRDVVLWGTTRTLDALVDAQQVQRGFVLYFTKPGTGQHF